MENKIVVTALAALTQETRLAIFRALVQAGPEGLAASKISETLGIAPSSLLFHLKELVYAVLISSRNESRFVIYSANFVYAVLISHNGNRYSLRDDRLLFSSGYSEN